MKKKLIPALSIAGALVLGLTLAGCSSDADTVSRNIATEAEKFNVQRTVVATSGITGEAIAYVEGRCSFELSGARVDLTCKVSAEEYRKYTIKLGDQDSVFIAMEKPIDVSEYHTKFVIRPQSIIPEFDIQIGEDE